MTRNELSQLYYLTKEIELYENELAEYNFDVKAAVVNDMPRSISNQDSVGDTATEYVYLCCKIDALRKKCKAEREKIVHFVSGLDDSLLRQIIYLRNLKLCGWHKIARIIGGRNTADSVKKIYYRFFKKK